jgi:hypothetical protein
MNDKNEFVTAPPIFILSDIRSGSTLLRYIIDTHPEICSPGELNLGELCKNLHFTVSSTLAKAMAGSSEAEREDFTYAEVRRIVSELMNRYAQMKGKRIWCEKTPGNTRRLSVLDRIFPDARYICLYRNCMDVVHSKIESHRLGWWSELVGYVMKNPENIVSGMVESWIDVADQLLKFEQENASRCFRIKYESIIENPERALEPLFAFLEVEWDRRLLDAVFSASHEEGHGDVKVQYTKKISRDYIGKGSGIRLGRVPPDLLEKMNHILEELQYPLVGPDWDHSPSPYLLSVPGADKKESALTLGQFFTEHLPARLQQQQDSLREIDATCKIIVPDHDGMWMIDMRKGDGKITPGDGKADCTITIYANNLLDVISGKSNAGDLYLQGKVRVGGNIFLANKMGRILFG